MPDISMCLNEECPLKDRCYRFTATPNEDWQSYAEFAPDENGECEAFRDNGEEG